MSALAPEAEFVKVKIRSWNRIRNELPAVQVSFQRGLKRGWELKVRGEVVAVWYSHETYNDLYARVR